MYQWPMAIRGFSLGARRGLVAAAADQLPNLVAIAGANGSGKSALLEELWVQRGTYLESNSEALYVGPNRAWRAGPLSDIASRGFNQDYEQILKAEAFPGFQYVAPGGFSFLSGMSRFGSNADDAQAFVKTSIVRIYNRADSFIADQFRKQGKQIGPGTVPDLLDPFRSLVDTLLPQLEFVEIDTSNSNDIKVLFRSRDPLRSSQLFDIDQLSSGEKAAIALFLPFIERRVRTLIQQETPVAADTVVPISILIDEPEIHLHPLLQLNILEYMRGLTLNNEAQFIFTTHSPTMLDALDPPELFLLSPASIAPDNQLSRLSDSFEKLEIARTITGATHVLTRGKPIVFTEGEPETSKIASDQRLMKLLVPQAEHWAIVPAGGRSQVFKSVENLYTTHLVALPGMPVFGLVDGDQATDTANDRVIAWPVAMIENLLLDPGSIVEVLAPYAASLESLLTSPDLVRGRLLTLAEALYDDEIRLRIQQRLPSTTLRPSGRTFDELKEHIERSTKDYESKLEKLDPARVARDAQAEVDRIVQQEHQLERFRGKRLLRDFYNSLSISSVGLGWNAFVTELARVAASATRTRTLTDGASSRITLYFPRELPESLQALPAGEVDAALIHEAVSHREAWAQGTPRGEGREKLREDILRLGRSLRDRGDQSGSVLMQLAAAIGTTS
jgi:hypothetical protein